MNAKRRPFTFRPTPENEARLRVAEQLGLNLSELVNDVLQMHLRERLEQVRQSKAKELQRILAAPIN